jgi:hypothetical protein
VDTVRIIGLIALLLAGNLVCCDRDDDAFVDNPPIGELTGTWVLQNRDIEKFDCSDGQDGPWPYGCPQLTLELPNPADPDPCPHFYDAQSFCLSIDDDTQSASEGDLLFRELLSGHLIHVVLSTDRYELVIRPFSVC